MAPHNHVRDQTWFRTPWVKEKELGMFGKAQTNEETEPELEGVYIGGSLSPDLWDVTIPADVLEGQLDEDGADDLSFIGHETRHVMTEVLNEVLSTESTSKIDPMVSHDGHVGSDCAVLFDCARVNTSTRGRQGNKGRKRARQDSSKDVWFGRVQKIRRKYNGK
ncbi:hypothetical protein R1sor_026968 [Riccia sorocarpa]|uniref:Uncharacterized protein n=1 Tax=Riccia sorocarpa TaxID=122646 RepID=A0ABD3GG67_9MARC